MVKQLDIQKVSGAFIKASDEQIKTISAKCTELQETEKEIADLEEQLKKNNSWFARNRGTVGLLTGLVVGAGMSVSIVYAVYQK